MKRVLPIALLLQFLFLVNLCWGRPPVDDQYIQEVKKTWTFISEQDGIQLFKKEMPDSSVTSFRGIGVLSVPMPILFHVIRDVPNSILWTPNLISKKLVKDISLMEGVVLSVNHLPWPALDRETLLRSKLFYDDKNDYFVLSTVSEDMEEYPPAKGMVRGIVYESNCIFRPVPGGTMVDLSALIDPKGMVPNWLTNFIQKKWPYSFLRALEDHAKSKTFTPEPQFAQMMVDFEKRQRGKTVVPVPSPTPSMQPLTTPTIIQAPIEPDNKVPAIKAIKK